MFKRFARLLREAKRKPSAARVHQLRTTARRIESAFEPPNGTVSHPSQKLLKQLARVRKRAGKVRDLDVQLAALQTVNIGREEKQKAELASELQASRDKQAEKLLKLLESKKRSRLEKRLRQADAAPLNATPAARRKYELRAQHALAQLLARATGANAFTSESLHQLRLEGKRTRYLFELAPESAAAAHLIGQLRATQDSIGEWHDWLTLTQGARKRLSTHSALLAALENTTRAKFTEAVRTVKRIVPELRYDGAETRRKPAARVVAEPVAAFRASAAKA